MFEYHLNNIKDKLKQLGLQVVDFDLIAHGVLFFVLMNYKLNYFQIIFLTKLI